MRVAVLLSLCVVACVNDYVVRKGDDEAADDGDGNGDGSSTTQCETDGCDGSTTAHGDDGGPQVPCDPCEADAECGDDWDNCVNVDVIGRRCLISCPEAGCPDGSVCRATISVDEVEAMQCVPQMGACADPDGG